MMILMMKIISNKDTNNNHLLIFYLKPLKAIKRNENDLFGISLNQGTMIPHYYADLS